MSAWFAKEVEKKKISFFCKKDNGESTIQRLGTNTVNLAMWPTVKALRYVRRGNNNRFYTNLKEEYDIKKIKKRFKRNATPSPGHKYS